MKLRLGLSIKPAATVSAPGPLLRTLAAIGILLVAASAAAQERPYFTTYDHHMEEPGSLEISLNPVFGVPKEGQRFLARWVELEYGVKGWWTTELYFDAQTTFGDSTLFTGYRWENRFRLFMKEHWINPVIYVEFENINGADKILKEIVGFDSWENQVTPNSEARAEKKREFETKLILSRDHRGWNFAGNLIAEKNLSNEPWEFGYALGVNRPLALAASPHDCRFCLENFWLGLEMFGGLGEWHDLALSHTSHYLAPIVAWNLPNGLTLRVSPAIGLTDSSHHTLVRFGVSYEIPAFGRRIGRLLH